MAVNRSRGRLSALVLGLVSAGVLLAAACTTTPTGPPPVTTTTLPPTGVHTDYQFNCQAAGAVQVDVPGGITVSAPATVAYGDQFTIDYVVDPITIPAYSAPATINWVGNWTFHFTIPTNSTFVSASVSGGQGYTGTAAVGEIGGQIVFEIIGTAPANNVVDYPVVSVTLEATGTAGSDIESSIGGTGYGDPGLTFLSSTNFGNVPTNCFPYAPVPTFSSTEIVGGPTGELEIGTCYTIIDGAQSFEYLGPDNALANSLSYPDSPDCSTVANDNSQTSILSGQADLAAAEATCQALLPGAFTSNISILEPIDPPLNSTDYWGCFYL